MLSELLRPQQLGDLTLPQNIIDKLQRMVSSGSIMNMLFYGEPGAGKTSAARLIRDASGEVNFMEVTGSTNGVQRQIEGYARSVSFFDRPKICFVDEADQLSKSTQAILPTLIEKTSNNCRFIFAANDREKLIPALQSRLLPICFDVAPNDRQMAIQKLIGRYDSKIRGHEIEIDHERLTKIVSIYYPDFRQIANVIQFSAT